eukprot:TRINITY_DN5276_c0_g1_i1.p1 TRINITY_DN5276_c0_g1~~TRINITY_DN5276_c0_g1_i1.p1  ORF type:complete len:722 (+),score=205.86 TRINITY_DN5276_c0_g1_i1:120-2285(+)
MAIHRYTHSELVALRSQSAPAPPEGVGDSPVFVGNANQPQMRRRHASEGEEDAALPHPKFFSGMTSEERANLERVKRSIQEKKRQQQREAALQQSAPDLSDAGPPPLAEADSMPLSEPPPLLTMPTTEGPAEGVPGPCRAWGETGTDHDARLYSAITDMAKHIQPNPGQDELQRDRNMQAALEIAGMLHSHGSGTAGRALFQNGGHTSGSLSAAASAAVSAGPPPLGPPVEQPHPLAAPKPAANGRGLASPPLNPNAQAFSPVTAKAAGPAPRPSGTSSAAQQFAALLNGLDASSAGRARQQGPGSDIEAMAAQLAALPPEKSVEIASELLRRSQLAQQQQNAQQYVAELAGLLSNQQTAPQRTLQQWVMEQAAQERASAERQQLELMSKIRTLAQNDARSMALQAQLLGVQGYALPPHIAQQQQQQQQHAQQQHQQAQQQGWGQHAANGGWGMQGGAGLPPSWTAQQQLGGQLGQYGTPPATPHRSALSTPATSPMLHSYAGSAVRTPSTSNAARRLLKKPPTRLEDRFLRPGDDNKEFFRHPRVDPEKPHLAPPFGGEFKLEDIRLPPPPPMVVEQMEQDVHRLRQRQKQIEFGMATQGYLNYMRARELGVPMPGRGEPHLPNIYQRCSKRSWDGQVRQWRQHLHAFDDMSAQLWSPQELTEIRERVAADEARRRAAAAERERLGLPPLRADDQLDGDRDGDVSPSDGGTEEAVDVPAA